MGNPRLGTKNFLIEQGKSMNKDSTMHIGILASGQLGYLCLHSLFMSDIPISFLFTDKSSAEIVAFARSQNIPLFVGNPRKETASAFLNEITNRADLIVSINYIFLLGSDIISFPKCGCINIHGSLLPKYRGRTPHVWAIIN